MKKRISVLLVLCMLLSLLPISAVAEGETPATPLSVTANGSYITSTDITITGGTITSTNKPTTWTQGTNEYTLELDVETTGDTFGLTVAYTVANDATVVTTTSQNATVTGGESKQGTVAFTGLASSNSNTVLQFQAKKDQTTHIYKLTLNVTKANTTVPVTKVTLNKTSETLVVGGTLDLKATVEPSDATDKTINWTSSDTAVAAVDTNGKVTAVAAGTAKITATPKTAASADVKAECTVTVTAANVPVERVTLNETSLTLEMETAANNKTATLKATVTPPNATDKTVTWESSDTDVAKVGETGEEVTVTAQSAGTATITATAGGKPATCTVTVKPAPITVTEEVTETGIKGVTIESSSGENETVGVVPVTAQSVLDAIATAESNAAAQGGSKIQTVKISLDTKSLSEMQKDDIKGVKLTANVIKKVNDYNTGTDTNVKDLEISLAVDLPDGIVTLDPAAIGAVKDKGDVQIILQEANLDNILDNKKPSGAKAAFNVNIIADTGPITGPAWGDNSKITLTVPPTGLSEEDLANLDSIGAYLDGVFDENSSVSKNGNKIDIVVSHLSVVSLAAKPTPDDNPDTPNNPTKPTNPGGGGGGGSGSKPSIKTDATKDPNAPTTTTGGGVAGFNDVAPGAWYADAVKYVVDKGLFGGVGNGNFAPNANMTRAMMWTVLARYMGVNTNTGSNWYEAAREWAIAQGISDGTMADGNVTREQFVTMLWRLCGEPAAPSSASFTDNGSVSAYAKTAVDWAVAQGIVNGYNDGSFKPQGSATRAEVAKMLTVFCTNMENAPAETTPAETAPEETTPEETAPQEAVPEDTSGDVG